MLLAFSKDSFNFFSFKINKIINKTFYSFLIYRFFCFMQVVDFLNSLYGTFDGILDSFDAYKVVSLL